MNYYPEERKKVMKSSNSIPHILLLDFFEQYDEQKFKYLKKMTCFHKLSYKLNKEDIVLKNTFYDVIINQGKY